MPVLSNARYERFAQSVAGGMSLVVAYEEAGYKRDANHACHLRAKPHVRARILELQRESAQHFAMVRTAWLEWLRRIAVTAEEKENFTAAIAALRVIGRAMPNWFAPQGAEQEEKKVIVILKKL
jgi:hypothetical protein